MLIKLYTELSSYNLTRKNKGEKKTFYKSKNVPLILYRTIYSQSKCLTDESKRRYALQQENLLSKFLYHSIGQLDKKEPEKLKYERTKPGDSSDEKSVNIEII